MDEDFSQFDHDLEIFLSEADKKLLSAREDLLLLKEDGQNPHRINSLLRTFHNIKSSAFSLNLPNIRRVAHLNEDILTMIRDKEINLSPESLNLVSESIDYLDEIIITLSELHFEGRKNPISFILKLKEFIDGEKEKKILRQTNSEQSKNGHSSLK
jgi:two-component system, chemotaxis family, sensor kinase CheA